MMSLPFFGRLAGLGCVLAGQRLRARTVEMAMVGLAAALALANGVSTVLECGAGLCPDNPVVYESLQGLNPPRPSAPADQPGGTDVSSAQSSDATGPGGASRRRIA